jgi:hypothetical protein
VLALKMSLVVGLAKIRREFDNIGPGRSEVRFARELSMPASHLQPDKSISTLAQQY